MLNVFGGKGVSWIWVVAAFLLGGMFCKKEEPCKKPCEPKEHDC